LDSKVLNKVQEVSIKIN